MAPLVLTVNAGTPAPVKLTVLEDTPILVIVIVPALAPTVVGVNRA